ncbi:translesion DNA synthesis-associated protein ImuA [Roseateles sp.]|uniref:translesion DNA synthesis-associated protein ImuA n=1 Tax=Roseateles sp. TaxID=1971397 RepID=UPI00286A5D36|nr:translesion DNA synthesis-associated protein ImuA [Roseateles sp.]
MLAADSSPSTPAAPAAPSPSSAAANSARLEGLLRAQVWRASSLGSGHSPCVGSGFATLNAELPGGGWPTQSLSEILTDGWAGVEWRLLAPALRPLLCGAPARPVKRGRTENHAERPLLLINPPLTPHLPGLQRAGLPPQRLIWIAPQTPAQQLWALEQAIKSNASAAILAWLPHAAPEQIRRLQSCAQAMDAPIFLFRPLSTQTQSSAAPLRLCVSAGPGWTLQLRILKRRGPVREGCLILPALPDDLAQVLTAQILSRAQPQLQPPNTVEARHALARPAPQPAATILR